MNKERIRKWAQITLEMQEAERRNVREVIYGVGILFGVYLITVILLAHA